MQFDFIDKTYNLGLAKRARRLKFALHTTNGIKYLQQPRTITLLLGLF